MHIGWIEHGLYKMTACTTLSQLIQCNKASLNLTLWYEILRHTHALVLARVAHKLNQTINPNSSSTIYGACQLSKAHRLSFTHTHTRTTIPFDIIHIDLWGPTPVASSHGMNYFLLLIGDFTRFQWIYVFPNKCQVASIFLHFESYISL